MLKNRGKFARNRIDKCLNQKYSTLTWFCDHITPLIGYNGVNWIAINENGDTGIVRGSSANPVDDYNTYLKQNAKGDWLVSRVKIIPVMPGGVTVTLFIVQLFDIRLRNRATADKCLGKDGREGDI